MWVHVIVHFSYLHKATCEDGCGVHHKLIHHRPLVGCQLIVGVGRAALSRATSLDGLYIMDLNEKGITAHPKVLQFYADMEAQQQQERS
jgi:hypothetical protein